MSSFNSDVKNENENFKKSEKKRVFTKEMLKELLNKKLNQRILKLENTSKEHISNLNYTSKYFKEFSKAIQQFSKFFEESEQLKEKEKEINDKKEHNKDKYTSKKSNESGGSTNLTKNNNKTKQNKKMENSLRLRSNTQGVFKSQQLKKQASNISLARSIFANKIIEEKKQNKKKQNMILSPEVEKHKSTFTFREGITDTPMKNQKSSYFLEKNNVNLKMQNTEKRVKKKNKQFKDSNIKNNHKYNNISELKTEERYYTEKEKLNIKKFASSIKKTMNRNKKNEGKKKGIKFNLENNIKEGGLIDDFSKTMKPKYINKTIDLNDNDKNNHLKTSISSKKKRNIKLNNGAENINDIKDIVKLVDNVNQNITKLLESNEILNANKSLMTTSLEMINFNRTFVESNYRSSTNALDNYDDEGVSEDKKISLKKKGISPNLELFKKNDIDNEENNKDNEDQVNLNVTDEHNKSNNDSSSKNEIILNNNKSIKSLKNINININNRYQEQVGLIENINNIDNNEMEKYCIKNTDVIDIFKKDKDKKILKNIFKYLNDIEIILFTSGNNYLNKERISFLDNKKEELLQILNLGKDETMEIKIKKIKKEFSEEQISNPPIEFTVSDEIKDKLKQLNNNENINIFKNDLDKNDQNTKLLIKIYKIFFILINKEKIYNISNENHFWKKCGEYLIESTEGNLGDFIIGKIPEFIFDSKSYNKIELLIKDDKDNFINELKNDKNYFISPLIKETLVYCGVIFEPEKTQGNIIVKNFKNNQVIINYLNNLKVRYFLAKYEEEDDE